MRATPRARPRSNSGACAGRHTLCAGVRPGLTRGRRLHIVTQFSTRTRNSTKMTAAAHTPAELAANSKAWPFEEARKLLKRLDKRAPEREVLFETGYGPSGLPHIGTFGEVARTLMVRHALRSAAARCEDAAGLLLRRHGRPAQGAHQRAEPGAAASGAGEAADRGARSVRHAFELRRAQQCAAARLPRQLRLRVRVPVLDRMLPRGPVRRNIAAHARSLRQGDGDHPADARAGPARDLFAVPADLAGDRQGAAGAHREPRSEGGHRHVYHDPDTKQEGRDCRSRAAM